MTVGQRNLEHVLEFETSCTDPDCELHRPEVIESDEERYTAKAWFLAGAKAMMRSIDDAYEERGSYDSNSLAMAIMELREKHGLTRNWP